MIDRLMRQVTQPHTTSTPSIFVPVAYYFKQIQIKILTNTYVCNHPALCKHVW